MNMSRVIMSGLVIGVLSMSAAAQPAGEERPGRRQQGQQQQRAPLSSEKASAAWAVQAAGVAESLSLDATRSAALSAAYAKARKSHTEAADKLREEMRGQREGEGRQPGGRGQGGEQMRELVVQERSKLEKSLAEAGLSADQSKKAMASLGSFNRQWDILTDTVSGFKLDAAKQSAATTALREFVETTGALRGGGGESGDREAARSSMQAARKSLNDAMAKVLSDEQIKTFEAAFGPGPGGGRGPEGGRGGEGEGQRRGPGRS